MTNQSYAPPAGVSGPVYTDAQVKTTVDTQAIADNLPPALAEAIVKQESGGNPYAIGDGGTSFGLFQLHKGGELGNLPGNYAQQKTEAFDPAQNAKVALNQVAAVYRQNPNADPGAIAAAAQRPADRAGYANAIDAILAGTGGLGVPGATAGTGAPSVNATNASSTSSSTTPPPFSKGTQSICLGPGKIGIGPLSTGNPACITIWSWARIGIAILGALLLLIGLDVTFRGGATTSAIFTPRGSMVPDQEAPPAAAPTKAAPIKSAPSKAPAKPADPRVPTKKQGGGGFYTKPPPAARAKPTADQAMLSNVSAPRRKGPIGKGDAAARKSVGGVAKAAPEAAALA